MKRSQCKDAPSGDLSKRNYLSWDRAVQPRCLRVELADGTFFALPYQHLVCVGFEPGTDDTINLTIARHEVKITGKNLRELALAFQRFTVDWVRELSARYSQAEMEGVCIASIKVDAARGSKQ